MPCLYYNDTNLWPYRAQPFLLANDAERKLPTKTVNVLCVVCGVV